MKVKRIYKGKHSLGIRIGRIFIKIFRGMKYMYNWRKELIFLKYLNKNMFKHSPKVFFYAPLLLVINYINGVELRKIKNERVLKMVYLSMLDILYNLDKLKIKKGELNRPTKNVIVSRGLKVYLVDFERSVFSKNPCNLCEFVGFLISKYKIKNEKLLKNLKEYKNNLKSREVSFIKIYEEIRKLCRDF